MKKLIFILTLFFSSSALLAQNSNNEEWYLQREDLDIFIKELGKGVDTVIVIHGGFGANHEYLLDAVKGLESKHRFIFYDQRGSLLSPTKKENLTFQKNVDDLFALVKALKLNKVSLFCHSMGTIVGMEFAAQHPEFVSRLVLSGTLPLKSDSLKSVFSKRVDQQTAFLNNRNEVKRLIEPYKQKGLENLRSIQDIDDSKLSHKDLTEYWRVNFAATNIYNMANFNKVKGGRAYFKQDASVMLNSVNWKYDYRDLLNNKIKTTIINGDFDFLDFNAEALKSSLKNYKNISLLIIPNAGHNAWIDNQVQFRNFLTQALK